MLGKENRLRKKKEFDNVWKNGRSSFDGLFGVKAVLNELPNSRFGVSVGLKFSKKAVERNSIRRKVRTFIATAIPNIKKNVDVVITCLPGSRGKKTPEVHSSLESLLKNLRLL
jgi:ribonuclease P protein component